MSNQASDISQEAQAELDALMLKAVRVFQEAAEAMLAPQAKTKNQPAPAPKLTLKI
ncbi:MAG: hypothetical protein K8R48_03165 [Alphaproteobacteria bacterium]|nr:hypothetical protein [Alphaproteobacteria bacterium]